ncbi:hypothetical protein ACMGE6_10585 [Macrococcus equi]|uniref:hypothetical protein n=1 Tax=Macrococcus equi TaxID=3395462 RepID=UPI0039BDB685
MKIKRVKQTTHYRTTAHIVPEHELLTKYNPYYAQSFITAKREEIEDLYSLGMSHTTYNASFESWYVIGTKIDELALWILEQKERLEAFKVKQGFRERQLKRAIKSLGFSYQQRKQFIRYQHTGGRMRPPYSLLPLQRELYKIVEAERLEANRLRAEKIEKDRAEKAKSLRLELCI